MTKRILLALLLTLGCFVFTATAQFNITITNTDNPNGDPHSAVEGETKHYQVFVTLTGALPFKRNFVVNVTNGAITQQYLIPTFPPQHTALLYVDVQWNCNVSAGNIVITETVSGISTTYNTTVISYLSTPNYCTTITPYKQNLLLGEAPQQLDVIDCSPVCHVTYSANYMYQWQVGDVPIGLFPQIPPSGFTNLPPRTSTQPSYTPDDQMYNIPNA
jgi:hypothetical protein